MVTPPPQLVAIAERVISVMMLTPTAAAPLGETTLRIVIRDAQERQ